MYFTIHSRGELSVELEPHGVERRSMFIQFTDSSSILVSKDEGMSLYMQLGAALDELDRDTALDAAVRRGEIVVDPLFPVDASA